MKSESEQPVKYYKRQSAFLNMKPFRQIIDSKREKLEALRQGKGIHPKRIPDPDHLEPALKTIAHQIDYAERVYREWKCERDSDFFHALIELAQANLDLARYLPHIVKDSRFIWKKQQKRGSRWPGLDKWIAEQLTDHPDITPRRLWEKLPSGVSYGYDFFRDGDEIWSTQAGRKSLRYSGFKTRAYTIKKKTNNAR